MDKSMDFWDSLIKGEIIRKDDDFVEDYGYINEADIANWFQTLTDTFDDMLSRIGVADEPEVSILGNKFGGRKSFNRREIIRLGNNISSEILNAGIEEWMTRSAEFTDDDSERSISRLLGSPEYEVILNALYEGVETLISTIFDTSYEGVRTQYDDPTQEDDEEAIEISPDEKLDPDLINTIWEVTEKGSKGGIIGCGESIVSEIEANLSGDKAELGEIVSNSVLNKLQEPELEQMMKELSAYVFQSFSIQYPYASQQIQQTLKPEPAEPPIQQEGVPPAEGYTEKRTQAPIRQEPRDETEEERAARLVSIEEDEEFDDEWMEEEGAMLSPEEQADRRRKKFEDKWASTNTSPKSWMDVLKNTGPTLTSSQGFTPAMHNITYRKKPCNDCEDKKTSCGCDE